MNKKEAFVYLWFDTKNRMFYLGYHKGTPDDSYTHSSTVMEKFTKTSIPSYMRRRILAMGTEQEMIELEKKLLDNRKEKCWDKYHNVTVAFPPLPMYGEDHWNWKGGVSLDPEKVSETKRKWHEKNPEKKLEYARKYYAKNAEKVREQQRKYYAKNREKRREHYAKVAEKRREYQREYAREWREKDPEKAREVDRKYYAMKKAKKKAEKTY